MFQHQPEKDYEEDKEIPNKGKKVLVFSDRRSLKIGKYPRRY